MRLEEPVSIKRDLPRGHNTHTGEMSINSLHTLVGTVRKRDGYGRIGDSSMFPIKVSGLHKYYKRDGTSFIVKAAASVQYASLVSYYVAGDPDYWQSIHVVANVVTPTFFCTYYDKMFSVDGYSAPNEWDGTTAQVIQGIPSGWGTPFAPKYIAGYKYRLFFAANRKAAGEYGSSIYFSEAGHRSSSADYKTINIIQALTDDGDIVTGLVAQDDYLAIFKQNSIHTIYGSSPDDFHKPYDIKQRLGAHAPRSIVSVGPYIFFMHREGLFHFDGQGVTPIPISKSVEHELNNIPDNMLEKVCACYWQGYYIFAYARPGIGYNDRIFLFNVFTGQSQTLDREEFGRGWSQWLNFSPSCFFVESGANDSGDILFGDDTGLHDWIFRYPDGYKDGPDNDDITFTFRKRLPEISPVTREKTLYGFQMRCKGFHGGAQIKILDDHYNFLTGNSINFPDEIGTKFDTGVFDNIIVGGDPEWGRIYEAGLGSPKAKRPGFELVDVKSTVLELMDMSFNVGISGEPTALGHGSRGDQAPFHSESHAI